MAIIKKFRIKSFKTQKPIIKIEKLTQILPIESPYLILMMTSKTS